VLRLRTIYGEKERGGGWSTTGEKDLLLLDVPLGSL